MALSSRGILSSGAPVTSSVAKAMLPKCPACTADTAPCHRVDAAEDLVS